MNERSIPAIEQANVNIEAMHKEALADVSCLPLDDAIPRAERAKRMAETVKNPYCFRVGDMGVKLEFPAEAPTLQTVFSDFLKRKKSGL